MSAKIISKKLKFVFYSTAIIFGLSTCEESEQKEETPQCIYDCAFISIPTVCEVDEFGNQMTTSLGPCHAINKPCKFGMIAFLVLLKYLTNVKTLVTLDIWLHSVTLNTSKDLY